MTALADIMEALSDQIQAQLCGTADPLIENLQVVPYMLVQPTPPSIDIYPASPFQVPMGYGTGNNEIRLTVRARVSTAANEEGQKLLLTMMDPEAATSLTGAIMSDSTLGNIVDDVGVMDDSPTDYGLFFDVNRIEAWLGATWTVRILPS